MIAPNHCLSAICIALMFGAGNVTARTDRAAPEPLAFLPTAARAMEDFRGRHGVYSAEWRSLSLLFRRDDWPTQQNKELWQPKGSEYVYRIAVADKDHFLIQALGRQDKPFYEIGDGMAVPRALPGAGVKLAKINPDVPEPKLFLPIAAAAMKARRDRDGRYPTQWRQLEITYSAIPHEIYDQHVRPGDSEKEMWMPRGCDYVYKIARVAPGHFLIQAINESSEVEYEIRDGMAEAVEVAKPRSPRGHPSH